MTAKEYFWEWSRAVKNGPQLLRHMAFRPRTIEDELVDASLKGSLRKALSGYSLVFLGGGQVIGSGVFILTGQAAMIAGPAVMFSYLLSGLAATLAAVCYAEFAMEYPVAGGGFTYIMITFGELPAWFTVANLLLEYVLGMAAIARGFSQYIGRLFRPGDAEVEKLFILSDSVDFLAFGLVLLLTVVAACGVRESTFLISVVTLAHLLLLAVIIVAEFTQASASNLTPVLFGGADNMLSAGAVLFFAFAGFDVVASASEEARCPEHVPRAIVATPIIATCVYFLMALGLGLMVDIHTFGPQHEQEFSKAAFSAAFLKGADMKGMYYVSCITALTGILTSLTVGLYGAARIVMCVARDWLLPPVLATVNPRTQTPFLAQLVTGAVVAMLALLVPFDTLSDLVSLGTVLVMWVVTNALLIRRYYPGVPRLRYSRWGTVEAAESAPSHAPGARLQLSLRTRQWLVVGHVLLINGLCVGLTVFFQAHTQYINKISLRYGRGAEELEAEDKAAAATNTFSRWQGEVALAALWLATTLSMQLLCPLEYQPPKWRVPWWLMPWLPSLAILLMFFIIGSLQDRANYLVFAFWLLGCLAFYLLISLPMSYIKNYKLDHVNAEQMNVVELKFTEGRWQPPRPATTKALQLVTRLNLSPSHLATLASSRTATLKSIPSAFILAAAGSHAQHAQQEWMVHRGPASSDATEGSLKCKLSDMSEVCGASRGAEGGGAGAVSTSPVCPAEKGRGRGAGGGVEGSPGQGWAQQSSIVEEQQQDGDGAEEASEREGRPARTLSPQQEGGDEGEGHSPVAVPRQRSPKLSPPRDHH